MNEEASRTESTGSELPDLSASPALDSLSAGHSDDMVSSQIFLRTINPAVSFIIASIPEGQPGKRAMVLIAKLLQNDANNIRHGVKEEFLEVMASLNFTDQMREFVNAVIERGRTT